MSETPKVQIRASFLEKITTSGLTDAGAARAIGVSRQYYQQVKTGTRPPSAGFIAGAVLSGLATSFDEVAEPVTEEREAVA